MRLDRALAPNGDGEPVPRGRREERELPSRRVDVARRPEGDRSAVGDVEDDGVERMRQALADRLEIRLFQRPELEELAAPVLGGRRVEGLGLGGGEESPRELRIEPAIDRFDVD